MENRPQYIGAPCCTLVKFFLPAMCFVCFAKGFGGAYMKSVITQIERRFDIASSHSGVIDGSFEMGNLLVIVFVSYFGAKYHRPRLMGIGCLIMAAGSFVTALPHFFQDLYKYETSMPVNTGSNITQSILTCMANHSITTMETDTVTKKACEQTTGSTMWIFVFVGNMLRGIGETPIMPLGFSYIDDFASAENTPLYIAIVQTVSILGPMCGFVLGSFLSKIYVDVGFVDLEEITITFQDSRWVGAWWLGFIITGLLITLSSIPFWFLPKTVIKESSYQIPPDIQGDPVAEQETLMIGEAQNQQQEEEDKNVSLREMAKDLIPDLKRLFHSSVFTLLVLASLISVNGFIGMITFKPKYMEQVFGVAASKAIFAIGIANLPAVALGFIMGGCILKKMNLGIIGAARLAIISSVLSCCLLIVQAFVTCNQAEVAGLTVSYQGVPQISYNNQTLLSQCNMECSCPLKQWDPVCAPNGMTYVSPCLAGCQSTNGTGKDMMFNNCTCISEMTTPSPDTSVVLGQCPRKDDCAQMFKVYMALSVSGSFISAFGGTASYIVMLNSSEPDLKSFAVGIYTLIIRTLGGIPPPIYFGALIDQTCLKWGNKQCGGVGACRLYDSEGFRMRFMGLVCSFYLMGNLLWLVLYNKIKKWARKLIQLAEMGANGVGSGHAAAGVNLEIGDADRESTI